MPARKQNRNVTGHRANAAAAAAASPAAAAASTTEARVSSRSKSSPPAKSASSALRSSLKFNNNSWYSGEGGEGKQSFSFGQFRPLRSPCKAAHALADNYTRSRNLAADHERYSYVNDCCDTLHRDYTLRFSSPPLSAKAEGSFSVLPEMRFAHGTALLPKVVKKQLVKQGRLDTVGNEAIRAEVMAIKAKDSQMRGIQSQGRFVAYTSFPPV